MNLKIYISTLIFFHSKFIGFSKLILPILKLLTESKNGHSNFLYCYLNMKIDISIMDIAIQIQKTYLI